MSYETEIEKRHLMGELEDAIQRRFEGNNIELNSLEINGDVVGIDVIFDLYGIETFYNTCMEPLSDSDDVTDEMLANSVVTAIVDDTIKPSINDDTSFPFYETARRFPYALTEEQVEEIADSVAIFQEIQSNGFD